METFKLEDIDRALFNTLRLKLVSADLLPDIAQFTNAADYAMAKKLLEADGVEVVEIYGVGGSEDRGERKPHKVTINRKSINVGDLGAFNVKEFFPVMGDDGKTTYTKRQLPASNKDISYEVRVITNSTQYDRILSELIYEELGTTKYISTYLDYNTESGKLFLLNSMGDVDVSSAQLQERLFSFRVIGVWVEAPTVLRTNIPQMSSVTFNTNLVLGVSSIGDDISPEEIMPIS